MSANTRFSFNSAQMAVWFYELIIRDISIAAWHGLKSDVSWADAILRHAEFRNKIAVSVSIFIDFPLNDLLFFSNRSWQLQMQLRVWLPSFTDRLESGSTCWYWGRRRSPSIEFRWNAKMKIRWQLRCRSIVEIGNPIQLHIRLINFRIIYSDEFATIVDRYSRVCSIVLKCGFMRSEWMMMTL